MVFLYFWSVFIPEGESSAFVLRMVLVCFIWFVAYLPVDQRKKDRPAKTSSFFTISDSDGGVSCMFCEVTGPKRYPAVFTLEATMVMGVVIMMLLAVIRYGCILHDQVTGSMILEEALIKVRYLPADTEKDGIKQIEKEGTDMGNPRIWLGEYAIKVERNWNMISGTAKAGEWDKEIEISKFRPGDFLREYGIMKEHGGGTKENGS